MSFKCAGCYKDIDYEEGDSLCTECLEHICNIKVSWVDDPNNKENDHETEEDNEDTGI